MPTTVYHYPGCTTCKKALRWLDERGVRYQRIDIVKSPPTARELATVRERAAVPLRKMFNTSGQSYREGGFKEKLASMSDGDALAALAADGKLIRRPIVLGDDFALVGFDAAAYTERFG